MNQGKQNCKGMQNTVETRGKQFNAEKQTIQSRQTTYNLGENNNIEETHYELFYCQSLSFVENINVDIKYHFNLLYWSLFLVLCFTFLNILIPRKSCLLSVSRLIITVSYN